MHRGTAIALLFIVSACAHDGAALPRADRRIVAEPRPPSPVTPPTPPPTPAVAVLRAEPPLPPQVAPLIVVATTERRIAMEYRTDVTYPVFALPDPAARDALDLHLRAALLEALNTTDGAVRGACTATLASTTLVSVMCDLTTRGGRETAPGDVTAAVTLRIAGTRVQRIDPTEAFAPGTRLADALCTKSLGHARAADDYDDCSDVGIALSPTAVVGHVVGFSQRRRRTSSRTVEVPYAELARFVRRDGPLAWAAGDAPPSEDARAATPHEGGAIALSAPLAPAALAEAYVRAHLAVRYSQILAQPTDAESLRLVVAADEGDVTALLAATRGDGEVVLWGPPPVRLSMAVTTDEVALRTRPDGGAPVRVVSAGTYVAALDGVVLGTDSVVTAVPGLPTFVGVAGAAGWLRSADLRAEDADETVAAAAAKFADAVPAAVRDDVMHDVSLTRCDAKHDRVDAGCVAIAGASDATAASYVGVYGLRMPDDAPESWAHLFFVRIDGAVTRMRVFHPLPNADSVVALAARIASDPPGVERWSFFALGTTAPSFTLSLPTAVELADADRVAVTTDEAHGLTVGTTHYTWTGTTFVAP